MSRKKTEKDKKVWISTLIQMVAIVVIVLLLRTFVIGTIYVKGSSMEPNFHHGDFLVINKLETRVASPQVDDIVICKLDNVEYQENIIKRVIGLPGDEIDLRDNGSGIYHLYINGVLVEEPYIAEPMQDKGHSVRFLLGYDQRQNRLRQKNPGHDTDPGCGTLCPDPPDSHRFAGFSCTVSHFHSFD